MKTYAIIPAAGLGSRLNLNVPKIFAPLTAEKTVWNVLSEKLWPLVDHIHLIISPTHKELFTKILFTEKNISFSLQPEPIGMGDAIFCGASVWSQADVIVIVWGDQVFVSEETLKRALTAHAGAEKTIALPVIQTKNPYVEYVFDKHNTLLAVKQSREGEPCAAEGFSDVGTFVLSTKDVVTEWQQYLAQLKRGAHTREINFLPFLPYLSQRGWHVKPISVTDEREARGINTQEDLAFFQKIFSEGFVS